MVNVENQIPLFLSRQEVAKMLGVSLVTLHNLKKSKIVVPTHKIGRKPLYLYSELLKQIELSNYKTAA
ncbi:helix-turn-helix domain-containing protein [Leeuwenhoekiella marinoflava]|uniref:Uncharacterized protein n=2 Tax=Leeuwenhoekiella marinoflava TaxID=988 RepID=A0A4V1KSV0_9FLAO|nr:helix-turn-helix domain-containing protein [Leeuwenhoekiella marinoflava]RXG33008.1 hypothetical protein DSL99_101 [Leeuwenhoekiella marinoflava]SHE35300.1 hypothetical protein SAMN02745246_00161 [Leeuwenhoekiella marinoflava DSM 3653]